MQIVVPQPVVSEAILSLYQHVSPAGFGANAIACLKRLFPESTISIDEVFHQSGEVLHHADHNYIDDPKIWEGWALFSHQHPGVRYSADGGTETVVCLSDLISNPSLQRLDLYQEVFKKCETRDQVALVIPQKNSAYAIALSASTEYHADQKELLRFLYPHIAQAQHNALLLEQGMLAKTQSGMGFIEITLQPFDWTWDWPEEARTVLSYFFDLGQKVPWQPPADVIEWLRLRRRLFAQGSREGEWRRLSPLVVRRDPEFLRLNLAHSADQLSETLTLTYRMKSSEPKHTILSSREKQVALWIAQGKANREIAEILGISGSTVKKHLERAFQKLGIDNRVALAMHVAALSSSI